MLKLKIKSCMAFVLLGLLIYTFRYSHGELPEYVIATAVIVLFWYLQGLKLALSNLRNILFLTLIFGALIFVFSVIFPIRGPIATMGLAPYDLNPAQIGLLKASHAVALEIHLNGRPALNDRYFKVGDLEYTDDGLHYAGQKKDLDLLRMPQTCVWANTHLTGHNLDDDTHQVKSWFVQSMTYSLSPGALHSATPLDQFLFDTRAGFCEHFAAAFSTILRLKGYRSRVAYGYAGGSWDPVFKVLTYENADAHAWVEVLDTNNHQYKIMDPTSWVYPEVSAGRTTETGFSRILLAGLVIVCLAVIFFRPRRGAVDQLFLKVSKIEKKHGLESKGLTLSERLAQLAPRQRATAGKMRGSLGIYLDMYRVDGPVAKLNRALKKSLAGW